MLRPVGLVARVICWIILSLIAGVLALVSMVALAPVTIAAIETAVVALMWRLLLRREPSH